ncbi:type II toxin-antitoxin system VapB family antitoxin [Algoriphagus halophytocola]|uniref:Type II toxin-antitoxin system VapB family antitoxin n=1 Tax=Algoriphagus halophytocola TaxID=2991499 RepID=A0ABY6MCR4_9BACT|nr:type II toxin-antitoxin system VapB family antitoxin [Algoriphagus sp. TR-M5]UZD21094.1 type II toxin-antitoxin system VapB family antitoxin [Algoriphagus sp. TR-M5]
MRTNIEIDEKLMQEAMEATGLTTKKATVEKRLQLILTLKRQKRIKEFRGKLKWEGDLDKMRRNSSLRSVF